MQYLIMNKKKTIGIDYSLSSPAICICRGTYKFENCKIYYLTNVKKYEGDFCNGKINGRLHLPYTSETQRHDQISDWAISIIDTAIGNIFIEGYNGATGSEGTPNAFLAITFPSGSNSKFSLPSAMDNALGGSTVGEYALFADRPGTGAINDNPQTSFVRYFNFSGSVTYPSSSDSKFGVVFTQGDASTDINYFYMASSGSEPSSTQ